MQYSKVQYRRREVGMKQQSISKLRMTGPENYGYEIMYVIWMYEANAKNSILSYISCELHLPESSQLNCYLPLAS